MKIYLRTLGCRLNQSEIDTMARQFQHLGHEIVEDPAQADQVVVNTCAVTQNATRDSRQLVRQIHRANAAAEINVTGCYAQIAPDEIAVLPGVERVVNNVDKAQMVTTVTGEQIDIFDLEPISRDAPGLVGRTRAFVKVQDGCDNACTFCVTTIARGAGRSRTADEIVAEVRYLHAAGYQEAVLTGVHLGSYGHDFGDRDGLVELVGRLLDETDMPRLRLSSLEPWDLSPTFFDLWRDPRVCRHLHLPLQSGCDATLRRMVRRTSQAEFSQLVHEARARIPGLRLTTDVIVGFPGETDAEFADSEAFIHKMDFAGLHVFRYSKRPGTAAARMREHVDRATKKARSARLIAHGREQEQRFAEQFVGETLSVLWEQVTGATEDGFINVGYTDNYVRVEGTHPRPLANIITPARIDRYVGETSVGLATPIIESIESAEV